MTSRIPAAALAALSLVALGFAIIRASCATAAIPAGQIAADAAMQSHGILGFEVITDAPRALDVRIGGAGLRSGGLRVRAGGDGTEQQLTGFGDPFVVHTRRDSLALGRGDAERVVARRGRSGPARGDRSGDPHDERDAWSGDALDTADSESLARILSLDVALAVQGTSLVFGGSLYASCTVRCVRAEACVQRNRQVATCADDIVVCAACLEPAP